ncbi:MAG TPA: FHA domain-containing protein [Bacteriovoracaceae bacterium]|nr:FHA domain-containing protein [Bacteriovoracaceae bacterium]
MKLVVLKNNVPINEVSLDTSDPFDRYEIFVGRSDDCHLKIDDPLISRHHFVLKYENQNWFCEKLTNLGIVQVNGNVSDRNKIVSGDEIKCGPYSLIVSELHAWKFKEESPSKATIPDPGPEPVEVPVKKSITVPQPVKQKQPVVAEKEEKKPEAEADLSLELDDESIDLGSEGSQQSEFDAPGPETGSSYQPVPEMEDFNSEKDSSVDLETGDYPVIETENQDSNFSSDEGNLVSSDFEERDTDDGTPTRFLKEFVNYHLVIFGVHAPYDRFKIDQEVIYIGRDINKCQIILNDPEVSSVHAVLKKKNASIVLEDQNSSNGTILNGERINRSEISRGDEFVIGSTTFTLEVQSDLLDAESERLMPVARGQTIEREEIEEEEVSMEDAGEDFEAEGPPEKSVLKRIWKNPAQRKKLIYAVTAAALMWVLLTPDEPTVPESKKTEKDLKAEAEKNKNAKPVLQLSRELENRRNVAYELGVSFFEQNKYYEALREFQIVVEIDPNYKKAQTYLEQTKVGLKRLEELETQKRAEEDRIKIKKQVEELLVKAREAVKERHAQVAETYFAQIIEKDPENIEVPQLKMELEAWQQEQAKIALERATKEASRKAMVDALSPGKTFYLKKEWYRSILKLEEFLRRKGSDEDLVREASDMLSDAKNQLASELGPLLGKARSFKEGQDLKSAYEAYLEILKVEPTNAEALNEVDDIRSQLEGRSKRIYREAIISESLSLFSDAKEKFQEVQQISPTDSEYYKKATDKLKDYLE